MRTLSRSELSRLMDPAPGPIQLGALFDFVQAIPGDAILPLLPHYCRRLGSALLLPRGDNGAVVADPELARRMILTGSLVQRGIFEVLDIPQDRTHLIG